MRYLVTVTDVTTEQVTDRYKTNVLTDINWFLRSGEMRELTADDMRLLQEGSVSGCDWPEPLRGTYVSVHRLYFSGTAIGPKSGGRIAHTI